MGNYFPGLLGGTALVSPQVHICWDEMTRGRSPRGRDTGGASLPLPLAHAEFSGAPPGPRGNLGGLLVVLCGDPGPVPFLPWASVQQGRTSRPCPPGKACEPGKSTLGPEPGFLEKACPCACPFLPCRPALMSPSPAPLVGPFSLPLLPSPPQHPASGSVDPGEVLP